jgi:hypothetical protein
MPVRLAALAAGVAWTCVASAQSAPLTPAASAFLRQGPAHALAGCDLWRHRCGSDRLVVTDSNEGEANDVPRRAEGMTGPGLMLGITFELALPGSNDRPHPLFELVRVSTSRWPLAQSLRLGDSSARVLRILGGPTVRAEGCWSYREDPDGVTLCFERDRLAMVQWDFFVD